MIAPNTHEAHHSRVETETNTNLRKHPLAVRSGARDVHAVGDGRFGGLRPVRLWWREGPGASRAAPAPVSAAWRCDARREGRAGIVGALHEPRPTLEV